MNIVEDRLRHLLNEHGVSKVFDNLIKACVYGSENSEGALQDLYEVGAAYAYEALCRMGSGDRSDCEKTIGEEVADRVKLNPTADIDVVVDSVITDRVIRNRREEWARRKSEPKKYAVVVERYDSDGQTWRTVKNVPTSESELFRDIKEALAQPLALRVLVDVAV